jgi:hypothetical protein
MMFECFDKFNEDTYYNEYSEGIIADNYHYADDIENCQQTVEVTDTKRDDTSEVQVEHANTNVENFGDTLLCEGDDLQSDDNDVHNLIDKMYLAAQQSALDGTEGIVLPPPSTSLIINLNCNIDRYMEAKLTCSRTCTVKKCWLSRSQAIFYSTKRGYLLVDEQFDLFQTFHHYTVECVKLISTFFYRDNYPDRKDNVYLRTWCKCEFTSNKSFEEVGTKMKKQIMCIGDYKNYISKIPDLDLIYSFKDCNYISHFIIGLLS